MVGNCGRLLIHVAPKKKRNYDKAHHRNHYMQARSHNPAFDPYQAPFNPAFSSNPPPFSQNPPPPFSQNPPSFGPNPANQSAFGPPFGEGAQGQYVPQLGPLESKIGGNRIGDDPLGAASAYCESDGGGICRIRAPLAEFELHNFAFVPFGGGQQRPFSIMNLSMIACGSDELRITIVRHIVKEMIRQKKWQCLLVYRLNHELSQQHLQTYAQAIPKDLETLLPHIRPPFFDPKTLTLQVALQTI